MKKPEIMRECVVSETGSSPMLGSLQHTVGIAVGTVGLRWSGAAVQPAHCLKHVVAKDAMNPSQSTSHRPRSRDLA